MTINQNITPIMEQIFGTNYQKSNAEFEQWQKDLEESKGQFQKYDFDYEEELRKLVLKQRETLNKSNAINDETESKNLLHESEILTKKINKITEIVVGNMNWEKFQTVDGLKPQSMVNVINSLKTDFNLVGRFKFNEFTQHPESLDKVRKHKPNLYLETSPIDDFQLSSISDYLNFTKGVLFDTKLINRGIISVAREHPFHPIKDHIEREKWDGIQRLDTVFIDYLGAEDTPLTRLITRTWFSGLIKRVYDPGCKFELMPILIGGQGQGKSSLIKEIMPKYYKNGLQKMDSTHQNTAINLLNNWVIEIAELSAMNDSKIEAVKDFLSTEIDKIRLPYATNDIDVPRHVAFIGTTNQNNFLRDKTGNRRFPTIKCGVQEAKLSPHHVDEREMQQVLAEAKEALENGQNTYLDKETEKEIAELQEDVMIIDEKESPIKKFIDMPVPYDWEDYTLTQKQSYFTHWNDDGETWPRFANDKQGDDRREEINAFNPTNKIHAFTINDILKIVFKRDDSNIRKDGLPSSVKTIIDNMLKPAPNAKWSYPSSKIKAQGDSEPRKQRHYKFNG